MVINSREVIKILKKNGFYEVSQRGSHLKMTNGIKTTVVPHPKKDLKIGLIKGIEDETGVKLR